MSFSCLLNWDDYWLRKLLIYLIKFLLTPKIVNLQRIPSNKNWPKIVTVLRKIPLVGWFSWNPCLIVEIESNKKKWRSLIDLGFKNLTGSIIDSINTLRSFDI